MSTMRWCLVLSVVLFAGCGDPRTSDPLACGPQASGQALQQVDQEVILPAGSYQCVVTDGSALPENEVTIERSGDHVVARPKSGRRLAGFLYGTRLALVSATVREVGIDVLQIQAKQQPDGTFVGTVERLRDGVVVERRGIILLHSGEGK